MKLLTILFLCSLSISLAQLNVKINQGQLKGFNLKSRNGRKYSAFLGIPYAQPPIGDLRFRNPLPADSWSGVLNATSFGNKCLQFINETVIGSEDCLYLNIYKPMNKKNNLPVMVWIHGGYFIGGSSSDFSAEYFLDKDVILVTLNYRLGIFGFFTTGDLSAPGNFGLKDQVLALKWVQKNIKAFGGNPKKVTLFGQSAGGASVSLHAISKASEGLFQQYIIQSGSSLSPWAYQNSKKFKEPLKKIPQITGCLCNNSQLLVNCLRKKSTKLLMSINSVFNVFLKTIKLTWTPTNEPKSKNAFLTDNPQNLLANNKMKDLPFMSGILTDEGLIVTEESYINETIYALTRLKARDLLEFLASYILNFNNPKQFLTEIENFYFNNTFDSSEKYSFLKSLTDTFSFGGFIYPELRMLEAGTQKMKNPNYMYCFGYGISKKSNGVPHGAELPYLFPKGPEEEINENISQIMVDLWTSFAINRKPTSDKLNPPNLWKPYEAGNRVYLQIGNIDNYLDPKITLSNSFYPKQMEFWKKLYSMLHKSR